jgi:hypothetical protein
MLDTLCTGTLFKGTVSQLSILNFRKCTIKCPRLPCRQSCRRQCPRSRLTGWRTSGWPGWRPSRTRSPVIQTQSKIIIGAFENEQRTYVSNQTRTHYITCSSTIGYSIGTHYLFVYCMIGYRIYHTKIS